MFKVAINIIKYSLTPNGTCLKITKKTHHVTARTRDGPYKNLECRIRMKDLKLIID